MAKNTLTPAAAATPPVQETGTGATVSKGEKPGGSSAGFYCYIGPSITGLIQNGTIYRGTQKAALTAAAAAIEKVPLIKTLIISGDALPEARLKVKRPGNALHQNYQRIAGKG